MSNILDFFSVEMEKKLLCFIATVARKKTLFVNILLVRLLVIF